MSKISEYKKGWSFKNNPYKDTEYGYWYVYGEAPNCDFNAQHVQPLLATYKGTFIEVLKLAVTLPAFYTWGSGGTIKKAEVTVLS